MESDGAFCSSPYIIEDDSRGSRIVLLPFSTISNNPLWLNQGEARKEEWDTLNRQLSAKYPPAPPALFLVFRRSQIIAG